MKEGLSQLALSSIFGNNLSFLVQLTNVTDSQEANMIISLSGTIPIDLLLNEIKAKVLACMVRIWKHIYLKKKLGLITSENKFVIEGNRLVPIFMKTLELLIQKPDFDAFIQNNYISSQINSMFNTLMLFAKQKEADYLFNAEAFLKICLPYLTMRSKELDLLSSHPSEFVLLGIDTCSK